MGVRISRPPPIKTLATGIQAWRFFGVVILTTPLSVINMNAAKALGLTVLPTVLARADHMLE